MSESIDAFLTRLARPHGDPGGGAASGVMTALAAAVTAMVSRYSPDAPDADARNARLDRLRSDALDAAAADGRASAGLGAALRPRAGSDVDEDSDADADAERDERIVAATTTAVEASARLGTVALAVWDVLEETVRVGNSHLTADLAVAADAVAAGIGGAVTNLRGGLVLVAAHGDASALEAQWSGLVQRMLTTRRDARALADHLGEP